MTSCGNEPDSPLAIFTLCEYVAPLAPDLGRYNHRFEEEGAEMGGAIGDFRRYQRRRNLSADTINTRCAQVLAFENWLYAKGATLETATSEHVESWLDSLALAPGSRYVYLSILRAFYRFTLKTGLLRHNPIDMIEPPKRPKRLPRPVDADDFEIACDEADLRMRAWLLLTYLQGLRVSSIAKLRVEGIDRRNMTLRVWAKGDKEHSMPLHPQTLAALDAYGMPSEGWVFRKKTAGMEHERLSPSTVSRYIGQHYRRLGSDATAHQGRHRMCTDVVENTGDITLAAELAGHANVATTQQYVKVLAHKGRAALAGLSL